MKVKDLPDAQIIVLCGSQASGKTTAKRSPAISIMLCKTIEFEK